MNILFLVLVGVAGFTCLAIVTSDVMWQYSETYTLSENITNGTRSWADVNTSVAEMGDLIKSKPITGIAAVDAAVAAVRSSFGAFDYVTKTPDYMNSMISGMADTLHIDDTLLAIILTAITIIVVLTIVSALFKWDF